MKILQKLGKAFMLPVALLPIAGLFLGIGTALVNNTLEGSIWFFVGDFMSNLGVIPFDNLPVLFAVSVTLTFTNESGPAALSSFLGFIVFTSAVGMFIPVSEYLYGELPSGLYTTVLGIETLQTGVFGGVLVGVFVAFLYNRYYFKEFPEYISFFSGIRIIPIVIFFYVVPVAFLTSILWPFIGNMFMWIGLATTSLPWGIDSFVFGVIERALIPFGLHHVFYTPLWFTEAGGTIVIDGITYSGDLNMWYAIMESNTDFINYNVHVTRFMAGKYAFMMFGLPAAAFAMYRHALLKNRPIIKGVFITAALTTFLTGITEPIEFTFLFVAPVLYGVHAAFSGLSFMITQLLDVHVGMTFSGGLIDLIIYGLLPDLAGKTTNWYLILILGLFYSPLYYFTFSWIIRRWNLKTPGTEQEGNLDLIDNLDFLHEENDSFEVKIVKALGNNLNIESLDACMTRLRITVKSIDNVDTDSTFKALGASGVVRNGNNLQIIFGTKADQIKTNMKKLLDSDKMTSFDFMMPIAGNVMDIKNTPDEVFAGKMMGNGFLIEPSEGAVYAPFDGKIEAFFPTKHAVGFVSNTGVNVLVHVGIDTVNMNGAGFTAHKSQGEEVKAGELILTFDLDRVKEQATSHLTPVVFTSGEDVMVSYGKTKAKEKGRITI